MFDPTVFDNLKVAFENAVYDLDNLDGKVLATGRSDLLEMAVMSRRFAIAFRLTEGGGNAVAEIVLDASLKELAAEILEQEGASPGCVLRVVFHLELEETEQACRTIDQILKEIWNPALPPVQTISYEYGHEPPVYRNAAEIRFNRTINEEQMEDVGRLVDYAVETLERLQAQGW
ncbi:hypothetical protein [Paenibacillus protaetiae]|uniref:Uncharacterized protein n=1 Tax=Paenibacillus protaetiae TaxID=2509456 RepID=A0A4P6EUL3_9BACL|nr:hypothetical protein [Paenibacillus protaetiae]QAY66940.1 hypothetical protein ET464_11565 [Paenibacillus protaetiae]